jgi:hypothetical protein
MYTGIQRIASADRNPFENYLDNIDREQAKTALAGITIFEKDGALTKRISLQADGSVLSDGSACVMVEGTARRKWIHDLGEFACLIGNLDSSQAITLGVLQENIAREVTVVTKAILANNPNVIARTGEFLVYRPGKPAMALLDFDRKGMPEEVAARIEELGGFRSALVSIIPELEHVACVTRTSTSAGLFRTDTGEKIEGSGGVHAYLLVKDGADVTRFLRTLHARCWLAGLGWHMLGAAGQLLERSIVDRMVDSPERLCFEGAPILTPPLAVDAREPMIAEGDALDTVAACPSLTIAEQVKLRELLAKSAHALEPQEGKARKKYIDDRARTLALRSKMTIAEAREVIERQCDGTLLPDVLLPFDDPQFANCTVGDVLANPGRFEGATLADPIEGVSYGRGKAKVYVKSDGTPWIRSFAHGLTRYNLKFDARAVGVAIEKADPAGGINNLAVMIARAALDAGEIEEVVVSIANKFKVGKRIVQAKVKEIKEHAAAKEVAELARQALVTRTDPRPRIPLPYEGGEWLPVMNMLNEIIGASEAKHPLARNTGGHLAVPRRASLVDLHRLTSTDSNAERTEKFSPLPAPDQWTIKVLSPEAAAEEIERHIEFYDESGQAVHLQKEYVRHYARRWDGALPEIRAVVTMPLVLADGTLFAMDGFDRERGIDFRIPAEVMQYIPKPEEVNDDAVCEAINFLCNEWLVDVATDKTGKAILIAFALSIIQRVLFPTRPCFIIVSGRRGSGKTTAIAMLIRAATGEWPAAAAWSDVVEERRKALFSYLLSGCEYVLWDNIPRGTQIACPHLEKALTSPQFSDRILGVSENGAPPATAIQAFTGNNVSAKGDLASRSLRVQLAVDQHDPENRDFRHPDPIAWTDANRGKILRAFYTVLLGNAELRKPLNAPVETRFKEWQRVVGSAVEHAMTFIADDPVKKNDVPEGLDAREKATSIKFKNLFLEAEEDDADSISLGEALSILRRWTAGKLFTAKYVAGVLKKKTENEEETIDGAEDLRAFLLPKKGQAASAVAVGMALSDYVRNPVIHNGQQLTLRSQVNRKGVKQFWVVAYGDDVGDDGSDEGAGVTEF